MRTYGREYVVSEEPHHPFIDEAVKDLSQRVIDKGGDMLGVTVIGVQSDAHWRIDCESMRPHSHIYLKWTTDEPA